MVLSLNLYAIKYRCLSFPFNNSLLMFCSYLCLAYASCSGNKRRLPNDLPQHWNSLKKRFTVYLASGPKTEDICCQRLGLFFKSCCNEPNNLPSDFTDVKAKTYSVILFYFFSLRSQCIHSMWDRYAFVWSLLQIHILRVQTPREWKHHFFPRY